jgi:hypothetical protein
MGEGCIKNEGCIKKGGHGAGKGRRLEPLAKQAGDEGR